MITGNATAGRTPTAVPDAVAPPPRHPRFPLLDGMRAVAVLCVVLVHCAEFGGAVSGSLPGRLLAHANIGVTIFFLISGFLLYRPFIAHRTSSAQAPRVGAYAKRRFLRIVPAYWLVLTAVILLPGQPGTGPVPFWPMYTLTQTIPIYSGPSCSVLVFGCSLAHTWSLGAEVSFYLVLPLYALATERLTRRLGVRAWAAAQAGLLGALSALSIVVQFVVLHPAPLWVGWTVTHVAFGVISLLLLAPVIFSNGRREPPQRLTGAPIMAWLGLISYGIFLWHFPVMLAIGHVHRTVPFFLLTIATLALSVGCAAASYYAVERATMRLKYRPWAGRTLLRRVVSQGAPHAATGGQERDGR